MSSVGPQLPPHLAKRKRDDDEPPNSPPRKVQAATAPEKQVLGPALPPSANPDEVDIGDSSEDEYGLSNPSAKLSETSSAPKVAGPTLPPSVAGPSLPPTSNPDEVTLDNDSSEDDYGPSIPKPTSAPTHKPPPKRVLGPAPPPASLSELPSHPANDSSSDDDDYGPALPPAPGSREEAQYLHNLSLEREALAASSSMPKKPQRDEWMLLPPTSSDNTRADPTKLKNRKFASGKGSRAPTEKGGGISTLWTETPEEKRKRLEDEVLGRTEVTLNSTSKTKSKGKGESAEDRATAQRIAAYNAKNRGESLLERRKREGGQKEEEDDPSQRGFDREKDMALGGLGRMEKRDMVRKAGEFGERFQKGSFL
ncbi:hypothetical protein GLAREA_08390 [Glarea lozoyensis ATCC 20868]|uniref:DUF3752 domain-containing protein n=2 Tax=Glarea lozoyensis TaxID=101852 RepID=S3DCW6_GLAL2|nr:uncharacterized protein GLAREA_08390 [Glarea lozoyensis ATCC 20868]EHL02195.1 hypothetical protein M7I_1789 [Glarea lozoyensis 74030]EPE24538.1 hypothetical protein GLAREA_08390 [Glarea lozoyensis ATCC 20868]